VIDWFIELTDTGVDKHLLRYAVLPSFSPAEKRRALPLHRCVSFYQNFVCENGWNILKYFSIAYNLPASDRKYQQSVDCCGVLFNMAFSTLHSLHIGAGRVLKVAC